MLSKGSGRGGGSFLASKLQARQPPSQAALALLHPVPAERRGQPWGWTAASRAVCRKGAEDSWTEGATQTTSPRPCLCGRMVWVLSALEKFSRGTDRKDVRTQGCLLHVQKKV